MDKTTLPVKIPGPSVGADLCVCPEAAQLPNRGRHTGLHIRCKAPKNLQEETTSGWRSGASFFFHTAAFVLALALLNGVAVAQRAATRPAPKNAEQFYAQGVALLRKGDS